MSNDARVAQVKKELEDMKAKIEAIDREKIKVEARYEQIMSQLKAEGLNSIAEAKNEVQRLRQAEAEALTRAETLLEKFKKDYEAFL